MKPPASCARRLATYFRFAIATARADNDPTVALRGALVAPDVKPRAAIVAPKAFGGLLRAIEDYDGTAETRCALEQRHPRLFRHTRLRERLGQHFGVFRSGVQLATSF